MPRKDWKAEKPVCRVENIKAKQKTHEVGSMH
jgi:hypothetical protein